MVDILTGPQAADVAATWPKWRARGCLNMVSRAFQRGSLNVESQVEPLWNPSNATAAKHWAAMPKQYKHAGDRNYRAIPKGAVIQCTGGDGHIFISEGDGIGRSTDYPREGMVSSAPIEDILDHFWGNPYAGWGTWINGRAIRGLASSTASTGGATSISNKKGTELVKKYIHQNRTVRSLAPGSYLFLRDSTNKRDLNIVGIVADYDFTVHVYAEGGKPGDALDVALIWENTKYPTPSQHASAHYTETFVFDERGQVHGNATFKRGVASGDMVFFRVSNPGKQTVKITLLGSEAYAF
jgi:hypothetical protein